MRIAMIASPIEQIPPPMYGGTERVISALTEELVKRGHDVTLFASGDSVTSAKLVSVFDSPLRKAYPTSQDIMKRIQTTLLHLGNAYAMQDQFDIIHDHTSYFGLSYAQASRTPVVATIHGCLNDESLPLFQKFNKPYLVTISHSQRKDTPNLNYISTIYNGLNMREYPYSPTSEKYLLAVGRFCPEKGIHNAITIAEKSGLPLIIAAKLEDKYLPYFNEFIKPRLSKSIRWVGEVSEKERNNLMSKALCFLHPLAWEEPFGLTLIEAMSCGTPIIAFDRGSMKEIIQHGKNGFIAKDIADALTCIKKIDTISREYCRFYSLNNFNSHKMAREYEAVYEFIIKMNQRPLQDVYQVSQQSRNMSYVSLTSE